jgi:pyrimidine operon attenuation protein/uracil phosphoribosyltransferase
MDRCVHNLKEKESFEEAAREVGISTGGISAARLLDQALESQKISVDRMDYFSILTSVFSQVCKRP